MSATFLANGCHIFLTFDLVVQVNCVGAVSSLALPTFVAVVEVRLDLLTVLAEPLGGVIRQIVLLVFSSPRYFTILLVLVIYLPRHFHFCLPTHLRLQLCTLRIVFGSRLYLLALFNCLGGSLQNNEEVTGKCKYVLCGEAHSVSSVQEQHSQALLLWASSSYRLIFGILFISKKTGEQVV